MNTGVVGYNYRDLPPFSISNTALTLWFKNYSDSTLIKILTYSVIVLITIFLAVMLSETVENCIGQLLGLSEKNKILAFLGLAMGGILLALQAVIANRRAVAMEKATGEQAKATEQQAQANKNSEQGLRQERLKNAIEHLGHKEDSVRLGGAYELFHLAQDTEYLRQTVLDILCAHIRKKTSENKYRNVYKSNPSEEIQSLLNLLFVQIHEVFKGLHINLQGGWLNGAELGEARLDHANLSRASLENARLDRAHLRRTNLFSVNLKGAELKEAYLQGADMSEACLHKATLTDAQLQGVNLSQAKLPFASLEHAQLQGAELYCTQFQGAWLTHAQLQGAHLFYVSFHCTNLIRANMQGAVISITKFQEAKLDGAFLQGITSHSFNYFSFEALINERIGQESDLSGMAFAGGLDQKSLDNLVEGLDESLERILRAPLTKHVGQLESHNFPDDRGIIVGSYAGEQAEKWIANYKEAIAI